MKRITLSILLRDAPTPDLWRADSARFAISAYGRTVAEAKQRLFLMTGIERENWWFANVARTQPRRVRY